MIASDLRSAFHVRGLDVVAPGDNIVDDFVKTDVREIDTVSEAASGAAAMLHLAGQPAEADFRQHLLPRNLEGAWAAYEAALRAGTPRFVFASTLQTIQGYEPEFRVPRHASPRPSTIYGSTKVFGEALGRYHADTSGLGVACLRMGAVRTADSVDPHDDELTQIWLGSRDLAKLVIAAIDSTVPYAIVTAVSPPATERFDTANSFGWTPTEHPSRAHSGIEGSRSEKRRPR